MLRTLATLVTIAAFAQQACAADPTSFTPVEYRVETTAILEHDDGKFLWFHPRVAAVPGFAPDRGMAVLMTLQRHLHVSDYYSGTYVMLSDDLGKSWSQPVAPAELGWVQQPDGVNVGVADVTPGWHPPTKRVLAVGAQVRYSQTGDQLNDQQRAHQTAYAVYDPATKRWLPWQQLEMPADKKFDFAYSACAQWLVQEDGTILLPIYFGSDVGNSGPHAVTVVQCSFDSKTLKYLRHGTEFSLPTERGLCEPSLAIFQGRYYLTVRHDLCGYTTAGDDGLTFLPLKPWIFDDGADLGSYNTQQHWITHSDGLFLVYTRRGANNDHMMRHRAPLFMAQVDPVALHVVRKTERVLIAERGATLGNFGAAAIDPQQSWVTVSEGVWNDDARRRGATGATFVARILWDRPNKDFQHTLSPLSRSKE